MIKTELKRMNKTNPDNEKQNIVISLNDPNLKDVILEDEGQNIEVSDDSADNKKKMDDLDWGDLSEFGPILPLGTDMLKDKPVYRFFKRFFDVLLSVFALVVLSPVLLLIALLIFLDDPHGSPIFIQKREGKNRRKFRLVKFRSMVVNAEELLENLRKKGITIKDPSDPTYKMKDDPRITRFGRFIRKTSIDELPQLINIILGHMSIVGPRPPLTREVNQYNDFAMQRLLVRPGLTCIWQSTRNRDEVKFPDWMKMDVRYIHDCGFLLDCKLILKTFAIVFTANGN